MRLAAAAKRGFSCPPAACSRWESRVTHNSPPRVYARPLGNSGIVQIIPKGARLPRPCAAQRGLDIILDCCSFGVDALPQRIEGAGQRTGRMDGAGAPLKKAAVSGFGVERQAQGRQAAFGRNIAFAERCRHNARREPQPPRNTVQIKAGQHQITPLAAAVTAARTGKIERFPCGQARAGVPAFAAAAGFYRPHRWKSSVSASQSVHRGTHALLWRLGVLTSCVQVLEPCPPWVKRCSS